MQFEGEYLNGEIWNGKKYNDDSVFELELKKGFGIEYPKNGKIKFEGKYLHGKEMDLVKNIMMMVY